MIMSPWETRVSGIYWVVILLFFFLLQPSLVFPVATKTSHNDSEDYRPPIPHWAHNTSIENHIPNKSVDITRLLQSNLSSLVVSPAASVQRSPHRIIPNSTLECIFSETQPLPGSVDVQVRRMLGCLLL